MECPYKAMEKMSFINKKRTNRSGLTNGLTDPNYRNDSLLKRSLYGWIVIILVKIQHKVFYFVNIEMIFRSNGSN